MPKLKTDEATAEQRMIAGVIKKYISVRGINPDKLCKSLGMSNGSYYGRMKNPSQWRLGEIRAVYQFLGVPEDERAKL